MAATLKDLVQAETKAQIRQRILDLCELFGLPTTSWEPGSWVLTLIDIFAEILADAWFAVAQIANGGILDLATGRWIELIAESQYDDARKDAVFCIGTFRLTDAGGGPHTITAGALTITTPSGLRFINTTGGTLPLNGTLDITVKSENPASRFNLPNDSTLSLVTSLNTVTVSNPAVGTTGSWISTLGADPETDDALRARLRSKWATLSTGSPVSAYEYWALSTTGVTRAKVNDLNPDGPGSVYIYIDAASSVSAFQSTLDTKRPVGTAVTAVAATTQSVSIPGTVTVSRASRATSEADATSNLTALAGRIPIGGKVYRSQVIEAVMSALPDDNISNFELGSSFSADVLLGESAIPQFSLALTYVEV